MGSFRRKVKNNAKILFITFVIFYKINTTAVPVYSTNNLPTPCEHDYCKHGNCKDDSKDQQTSPENIKTGKERLLINKKQEIMNKIKTLKEDLKDVREERLNLINKEALDRKK